MNTVTVEIVGYRESECSPFPCDEDRTCGLSACAPRGLLVPAVEALRARLKEDFSDSVAVHLTLLDEGIPDYVREIYEAEHPAIPMVLINQKIVPIGRIAYQPIHDALEKVLRS